MGEYKQVIILRKDLNMRKGKMVSQGCHASVAIVQEMERQWCPDYGWRQVPYGEIYNEWSTGLQTKVCVGVSSEQELQSIYDRAKDAGIPCSIITDAGKTEFGGVPTKTSCALGPAECSEIDKITGHLTLL